MYSMENKHWWKNHIVAPGSDPIMYYWVSFTELFITLTFLDREFKNIPGRCMRYLQVMSPLALMDCVLALLYLPYLLSMGLLTTSLSCFPYHNVFKTNIFIANSS